MNRCHHCNREFRASRITQKYCKNRDCQKSRKRSWQKAKLQTDPDYKANQREAQKRWCEKNPGYWKDYRSSHPVYTTRNRQLQQTRNIRMRVMVDQDGGEEIAKMDAKEAELSGTYYLFSAASCTELPDLIAKMDAKLVKIQPVMEKRR